MHMCFSVSHGFSFISGTWRHILYVNTKGIRTALQVKHKFSGSHIPQAHCGSEVLAASRLLPRQSHVTQLPLLLTSAIQNLSYLTCVSLASHCRVLAKSAAWEKAFMLTGYSCRNKWNSFTRPSSLNKVYGNMETWHFMACNKIDAWAFWFVVSSLKSESSISSLDGFAKYSLIDLLTKKGESLFSTSIPLTLDTFSVMMSILYIYIKYKFLASYV